MIMSLVLFENEFLHIVSISFTALILNELIMVALEITTWLVALTFLGPSFPDLVTTIFRHLYMVVSEIVTLFFYIISIAFLPEYFGGPRSSADCGSHLTTHRSLIRRYTGIWMEGCRHRRHQRTTTVYNQTHSE